MMANLAVEQSPDYCWLRGQESDWQAPVRLVCFHHAGGGASSFNSWRRQLPDDIGLLRAQLPGREDHPIKEICTHHAELVPDLVEQFDRLLNDERPYVLYGHSLGAIVVFELLREFRRQGKPMPAGVFISGRRAPHLPLSHPELCHLPDDDLVHYLTIMGGTVGNILQQPKWRAHLFPTIRADLKVSDLYQYYPEPELDCTLTVFGGDNDQTVHQSEWEQWSQHFSTTIQNRPLSGKHFFDSEGTAELIQEITQFCQEQQVDVA